MPARLRPRVRLLGLAAGHAAEYAFEPFENTVEQFAYQRARLRLPQLQNGSQKTGIAVPKHSLPGNQKGVHPDRAKRYLDSNTPFYNGNEHYNAISHRYR
jgi:hypothetical protein